jgi:PHD/YefM family antitoxin component YafN of YafNO toxin-antitoxin module
MVYPEIPMVDTIRVSATEFSKEVGRYQDLALGQAVIVTRNGRDRTVMISAEEYQRLKRRDRQVYAAGELPDEMIEAIRQSEMDPRHQHLDALIEDWTP